MKKSYLYILISILLTAIVGGLVGWSLYIAKQQKTLQKTKVDITYPTNGTPRVFGSLFGVITPKKVTSSSGISGNNTTSSASTFQPRLQQLYTLPVSGFTVIATSTVLFTDRSNGNIFKKILTDDGTVRINQTTLPAIYESQFVEGGSYAIQGFFSSQGVFLREYTATKSSDTASSTKKHFLTKNISSLVVNPDTTRVAYLVQVGGGSVVYVARADGTGAREVFRSLLRGWTVQWQQNDLLLTQNGSAQTNGSAFLITLKRDIATAVVVDRPGLTTLLSPNAKKILISTTNKNDLPELSVVDIATQTVSPLSVIGLSEKCVWYNDSVHILCGLSDTTPKALYPDDWYQGVLHFRDSIWSINTTTNTLTRILASSRADTTPLDITSLMFTTDQKSVIFKNKIDQTLWSLQLAAPTPVVQKKL